MSNKQNKILIVDDNPANIFILLETFKRDFKVIAASSGSQALELAMNKPHPDLILMDVMMPGMDGFEACRVLKEYHELKDIPVIFITALSDAASEIRCFEVGGTDFITKPIIPEVVISRVKNQLELKLMRTKMEELVQQRTEELRIANSELKAEVNKRTEAEKTVRFQLEALEQAYNKLTHMQVTMIAQEKLASIGHLSSGIAHEINNPLSFISCNVGILNNYMKDVLKFVEEIKSLQDSGTEETVHDNIMALNKKYNLDFVFSDAKAIFEECDEGFERINNIIANLLSYARSDSNTNKAKDINSIVRNTLALATKEIKYIAAVELDLDGKCASLYPSGELSQVVLNIVMNAAYAIKSQNREGLGNLRITTCIDGNYECIDITDDGPGIPQEIQSRIFEAFFTTKPEGEGTGLGMSIAYDIVVNKLKGKIELYSKPGKTSFRISLPVDH